MRGTWKDRHFESPYIEMKTLRESTLFIYFAIVTSFHNIYKNSHSFVLALSQ